MGCCGWEVRLGLWFCVGDDVFSDIFFIARVAPKSRDG